MSKLDKLPVAQALAGTAQRGQRVNLETVPFRDPGALSAHRSTGLDIIVRRSAMSCIRAHGVANPEAETYGILVGNLYRDVAGPYLLIEQIIQAESAGSSVFTPDSWQNIQTMMEEDYPESRIVGWYRTYPGQGIFLSESDRALHESYFGIPWQAALIYNPQLQETGIFSTRAGSLLGIEYLIETDQSTSSRLAESGRWSGLRSIGRMMLALVTLGLFAAMGYLLGLLVLQIHFHLPPQYIPG
jgi:proteasome lid subunit RPN8/RPN11